MNAKYFAECSRSLCENNNNCTGYSVNFFICYRVTKEVDIASKEAKKELKRLEESKKSSEASAGPSIPGY